MPMIKKSDWKTKPIPEKRENFGYENFFSDADAETLLRGFKPRDMDDKWFVYSDAGWVYFVRSWTGHHIFGLKLWSTTAGGSRVIESWVNANTDEYNSPGKEASIQLIKRLLQNLFHVTGDL